MSGPLETNVGATLVRTCDACGIIDACGNTVDYAQTITIEDNVAPEIAGSDLNDRTADSRPTPPPAATPRPSKTATRA